LRKEMKFWGIDTRSFVPIFCISSIAQAMAMSPN